jgi:[acyl-carrier-protein] S-malonyltransferase
MSAFLFPGQGAQYPGMGKDFFEIFSEAREVFEEADEILGESLSKVIFEGPSELLTQTKHSQLGIFVVSAAMLRTIQRQMPHLAPHICSGLSLGEYSALYAAGKLSFKETILLVKERALFMNEACESAPGTMAAVLGMEGSQIEEALKGLKGIWIANYNCPGQIVISGTVEGVEAATAALKERGAKRVLPLNVHGAFHSGLMRSAEEKLAPFIQAANIQDSGVDFVMNASGKAAQSIEEIKRNLACQVTHSVRWEQGIRSMENVNLFLEIGCGRTLSGLNKKIGAAAPTLNIEKVADLDALIVLNKNSWNNSHVKAAENRRSESGLV